MFLEHRCTYLTSLDIVPGTELSATPYAYTLGDPTLVIPLSSYTQDPVPCEYPVILSVDVTDGWITID